MRSAARNMCVQPANGLASTWTSFGNPGKTPPPNLPCRYNPRKKRLPPCTLRSAYVLHWNGVYKPWKCAQGADCYQAYWEPYRLEEGAGAAGAGGGAGGPQVSQQ
jgi:hypothetical protein